MQRPAQMSLLHPSPSVPNEASYGIHPHKDTNVFTILHPDPVGGLLVRTTAGEWVEATCPPGALLVNTGDMMELWSGGRFVSTPHQVVNTRGGNVMHFPIFLRPAMT
jgi:isopenicillin N synthase-like dioxygenase